LYCLLFIQLLKREK